MNNQNDSDSTQSPSTATTSKPCTTSQPWTDGIHQDPKLLAEEIRDLQQQIKRLTTLKETKLKRMSELSSAGVLDEYQDLEPGRFIFGGIQMERRRRTSWKYTDAVKKLQKYEQDNHLATFTTTNYWHTTAA